LTNNQIIAGMATFGVFLLLWVVNWIGSFSGPTVDKITQYLSIIEHFDDFAKGIVDTSHVIYYISFISFGLFLTAKSVDSERWRAREQAVGSDGEQGVQLVGADPQRPRQARCPAAGHGLRAGHRVPTLSGQAEGVRIRLEATQDGVRRSRKKADDCQTESDRQDQHDSLELQGPHRAGDGRRRQRAGHHQRGHQGGERSTEEGLFRPGPWRTRSHDLRGEWISGDQ